MDGPDWGQGLPMGILSMVSKAAGYGLAKAMRGVCHTWKEEFEFSVIGIFIGEEGPSPGDSFSELFPSLTRLCLGECPMNDPGLASLAGLKHLATLSLGTGTFDWPEDIQLAGNLTAAGLQHILSLPLTSLDLSWCRCLSPPSLGLLQGMPSLRSLDLQNITLTDECLGCLRGLPLTSLNLHSFDGFHRPSDAGFEALAGMPLTRLNLNHYTELTAVGLAHLRGLPLTDLNLKRCLSLTSSCLEILRGMPLRRLDIGHWQGMLDDEGLEHLRGLPLERLDLAEAGITDRGLGLLRGMRLVSLDLSDCVFLTRAGLDALRNMPLSRLNISFFGVMEIGLEFQAVLGLVGNVLPADVEVTQQLQFEV